MSLTVLISTFGG